MGSEMGREWYSTAKPVVNERKDEKGEVVKGRMSFFEGP
jgi:hypothetical protein